MEYTTLDYLRAFGLTIFAGLSTGIGGLVVFRKKPINQHLISGSLGFSAGVMIYISFVEMLNNSFSTLGKIYGSRGDLYTVLAFFGGIAFSMVIDFLIPEAENPHEMRGVEEVSYDPHEEEQPAAAKVSVIQRITKNKTGKTNGGAKTASADNADNADTARGVDDTSNVGSADKAGKTSAAETNGDHHQHKSHDLTRVGLVSSLAIIVHNLPEGLATFVGALADPKLGFTIAIAIAIHNIPEGIAVAVPLYAGTGDKWRAFLVALFSGLAEPIGALIGFVFLRPFISDSLMGIIFAAIAGVMVFISLDELLPSAEKQGEHHIVIAGLIAGMAVMAFSLLLL